MPLRRVEAPGGQLRSCLRKGLEDTGPRECKGRAPHFQGPGGYRVTNKKYPRQAWTQMSSPREGSRGGVRALCMDGSAPDPVPAPRLAELCARLPCAFEADASSRPLGRWRDHQL